MGKAFFGALLACCLLMALTAIVDAQNNCVNPLFAGNPSFQGALSTTPAPAPANFNQVCPNVASGADSCCSSEAVSAFRTSFNNMRNSFKAQVMSSSAQRSQLQDAVNQMRSQKGQLLAALKQSNPNFDENAFNQNFDAFISGFQNWVNNFGSVFGRCAQAILKYTAGMFCLSCNPNWSPFVASGSNSLSVTLSTTTCTEMQQGCVPIFEGLVEPMQKLLLAFGIPPSQGSVTSPCGSAGCQTFVCSQMVRGLSNNIPSFGGLPTGTAFSNVGTLPAQVSEFLNTVHETTNMGAMLSSAGGNVQRDTTVTNQYTESGYPAYSTGASASAEVFDTSTSELGLPGSATAQAGFASMALFLIAAIVAFLSL